MTRASNRLILLHTNDLHSCFANMAKLATVIRRFRAAVPPEQLLLVDCGDHMDRMYGETEGTGGAANVAVMNATGYDVFVPGNNEGLTFTRDQLDRAMADAAFAVLGTNLAEYPDGGHPRWLKRTLMLDKGGRNIGLIGVTAPFNDFYEPLGWHAEDPLRAVEAAARELREQTDLLIVLSHVGLRFDRALAERIPEIDCILGGHTHHLLERAERRGPVLIGAAGKLGNHLGVVEIRFADGASRPVEMKGYTIDVTNAQADPEIARLIGRERANSGVRLDRPAVVLSEPMAHDPLAESALGNLLADGLRKWTDAEIGLVNSGQLLGGLDGGLRSERDLLAICPSPINPCSLLLSGRDIVTALEQSLTKSHARMEIRGFGFRGHVLGILSASGMTVRYDRNGQQASRIVEVRVGGKLLEPDRHYKVGTIDMFTFGAGYPTLGQGLDRRYHLPEFLRDVLRRELADEEAVQSSKSRRFIPIV